MSPLSNNALEDWMSLYSENVETIWNKDNEKELRRISMLMHALHREFQRIEDNLNEKVKILRQQVNKDKENIERNLPSTPTKPKSQETVMSKGKSPLNKSPKLNKHRKSLQLKKDKRNLNVQTVSKPKLSSEDLFDTSLSSTSSDEIFETASYKLGIDFLRDNKRKSNIDVVDSSFVIEQTPNKPLAKKLCLARKISSNDFNNSPTQMSTLSNSWMSSKNETKLSLASKEKKEHKQQSKNNFIVPTSFLQGYDKVPVNEDKGPQHVHKTETVRRKVDRLKLPGWSCNNCKAYYEGSNLSADELHKKMDACSKHRNRFPPSDETFAGFWDVAMPDSEEIQNDDDLTVIQ